MAEIGIRLEKNQNILLVWFSILYESISIDFTAINLPHSENNRNTDVAWLKKALSALQGAQRDDGRAEEIKERADLMEKIYSTTDVRYTFMYLDTIVLSDVS